METLISFYLKKRTLEYNATSSGRKVSFLTCHMTCTFLVRFWYFRSLSDLPRGNWWLTAARIYYRILRVVGKLDRFCSTFMVPVKEHFSFLLQSDTIHCIFSIKLHQNFYRTTLIT